MDISCLFDSFVAASTFRSIQQTFYQLCLALDIQPTDSKNVYRSLRKIPEWKAQKLWKLLDKKFEHPDYKSQSIANHQQVLIIGAGPCGLRSAIECALLGASVHVVEQRDKFSRNNVLHLWEFVIHDLKSLGAKVFFPKFCTGSIEHISIRQLQCILLKTALCFGVQIHDSTSFLQLIFPEEQSDGTVPGFRAQFEPMGSYLSKYEWDIIIGADGKRNTLPGFPRDEMRGKLAIGITANYVNKRTPAEERVPEISGVAYIFNQAFFKELLATTGVDLENIVYYKDDTHYFVMTAKKQSLIEMGVIIKDEDDISALLTPQNVDRQALCRYATAAAEFATNGKLPSLEFARNHHGTEDIAMFDFTSLFSSRCAVRLVERKGKTLLMGIVGDSLHEPFWPTGSGCARGFLGVLDTSWLIREYSLNQTSALEMIAERESVYRLLAQVTKDNMHKALSKFSIDPRTRYVQIEMVVQPDDARALISTDKSSTDHFARPTPFASRPRSDSRQRQVLSNYSLLRFIQFSVNSFKCKPTDLDASLNDGRVLAALISKFKPDILDAKSVWDEEDYKRLYKLFDIVENELKIPPPCRAYEWKRSTEEQKIVYVKKICDKLQEESAVVQKALITPRAQNPQKRKAEESRTEYVTPKRCEPIERITRDLLEQTSGRDQYGRNETIDWGEDGTRKKIEKLDIELVKRVEMIVSGQAGQEKMKDQRERRRRESRNKTQSITKEEIQRVEEMLKGDKWQRQKPIVVGIQHLSSQEEKIIRTSTAAVRKEAERGFDRAAEREKFKEIDEKMKEAEERMERRQLNGTDPFGRKTHQMQQLHQQQRSAFTKPIAPVQPTQPTKLHNGHHQTIVISNPNLTTPAKEPSPYDSVNPNQQIKCQLCQKVVYLAERMQVEGQFIHKGCFRCSYCGQPLRLGEHGKDHDLDYHYPFKFFCRTHLRLPLREKIARIEKTMKQQQIKRGEIDSPKETVVIRSEVVESSMDKPEEDFAISKTLNYFSSPLMSPVCTASPSHIQIESEDISLPTPVGKTPERAEFGTHRREPSGSALTAASPNQPLNISISSESDEEEPQLIRSEYTSRDRERDSGSNESEDEESLEEAQKEELDRTLQLVVEEQNGPITDEQARRVWERVVERKSIANAMKNEAEIVMRRTFEIEKEPEIKPRAQSLMVNADSIETYLSDKNSGESIEEIAKKRMAEEIQRLKEQKRQQAKEKTDDQLGIPSNKFSVPVVSNLSTPTTSRDRSTTVFPPRVRKPEGSRILDDMPSLSRGRQKDEPPINVDRVLQPKQERIDVPNITGPPMQIHSSSERIHSESSKETNILINKMRRMKVRQKTVEVLGSTVAAARASLATRNVGATDEHSVERDKERETVPCAAVAPSPRERKSKDGTEMIASRERTSTNNSTEVPDKAVQYVQKRAEKLLRQREEESRRNAQDIQRGLEECEVRKEVIQKKGSEYEEKLSEDPQDRWVIECWLALVQELEFLIWREQTLKLRARDMQLAEECKRLDEEYRLSEDLDDETKAIVLDRLLKSTKEKVNVRTEMEACRHNLKRQRPSSEILKEKNYDFRNFENVFRKM